MCVAKSASPEAYRVQHERLDICEITVQGMYFLSGLVLVAGHETAYFFRLFAHTQGSLSVARSNMDRGGPIRYTS